MNIIRFFEALTEQFNKECKCGRCWTFGAPLSASGINASNTSNDAKCCTHLYIEDYSLNNGYRSGVTWQMKSVEYCDHTFTLYAVEQSNLGINVYNEEGGHSIDDSLWREILEPLLNCLGCGNEIDLCSLNDNYELIRWRMDKVILEGDSNYVGWKISGIYREHY